MTTTTVVAAVQTWRDGIILDFKKFVEKSETNWKSSVGYIHIKSYQTANIKIAFNIARTFYATNFINQNFCIISIIQFHLSLSLSISISYFMFGSFS